MKQTPLHLKYDTIPNWESLMPVPVIRLTAKAACNLIKSGNFLFFSHKFVGVHPNSMALPVRMSDINNDHSKEICDHGHSVLATHLDCKTDFSNFIRHLRSLCINFATLTPA